MFEINYNFLELIPEPEMYNYYNIPIKYLEFKFGISKKDLKFGWILLLRDLQEDVGGIHFFIYTNEKDIHHCPHIHCKYGGEEFRVNLENINVLDKDFKNKKQTNIALKVISLNQKELIKYWNQVVVHGEKVKFKMYIPNSFK